jgi:hypothetical protein
MDTRKDTCTINMKSGCLSWCILRDLTALSEEDIRGFPKVESSISCCKLGPKITNQFLKTTADLSAKYINSMYWCYMHPRFYVRIFNKSVFQQIFIKALVTKLLFYCPFATS